MGAALEQVNQFRMNESGLRVVAWRVLLTVDPRDCYLGVPETVNSGPVGLARFSTLRAWLSQWSVDHSRADVTSCVTNISALLRFMENSADNTVPVSHPACVFNAATGSNKRFQRIDGATHY